MPLPVLPPYAYGGGYVLSIDLVSYIMQNQALLARGLIRDKDGDRCCDVDNLQVGLWMFALGVEPVHESRFNGLWNCHKHSIVLFDVPEDLMVQVHREKMETGLLCNEAVQNHLLANPPLDCEDERGIRLVLLRKFELAASFFAAQLSDPNAGGRVHNAEVLLPLVRSCLEEIEAKGETVPCADYLVDVVQASVERAASIIQAPRVEQDVLDANFAHV